MPPASEAGVLTTGAPGKSLQLSLLVALLLSSLSPALARSHCPPGTDRARVSSCDPRGHTPGRSPESQALGSQRHAGRSRGLPSLSLHSGWGTKHQARIFTKIIISFEAIWEADKQDDVKERTWQQEVMSLQWRVRGGPVCEVGI